MSLELTFEGRQSLKMSHREREIVPDGRPRTETARCAWNCLRRNQIWQSSKGGAGERGLEFGSGIHFYVNMTGTVSEEGGLKQRVASHQTFTEGSMTPHRESDMVILSFGTPVRCA